MSQFLSARFQDMEEYTPGEQPRDRQYVKLNTNESPYPPSPEVLACLTEETLSRLNLYPDPTGAALKEKLAGLYGLEREQVFLANGSDEVLNFAFMAFCDQERGAIFPDITYGFYPVYARLYGVPYETVPLRADFSLDYRDYLGAKGMVVIANPNAPTGMDIPLWQVEEILKSNPHRVVLVDEAYVDFGGVSCAGLVKKYDNLLVSMTFSKSRSMAGARLGFGLASQQLIRDLEKMKYSTNPYNINRLTLAMGEAAIESDGYFKANAVRIATTRSWTAEQLERQGFSVLPSKGNFLFATCEGITGGALYAALKAKGVLVRHFPAERISDYIRITIGTREQMERFVEATAQVLEERRRGYQ